MLYGRDAERSRVAALLDVARTGRSGVLVIRGIRRRSAGEQRVVHMEIDYGPFERQVPIAEPVDAEAAEASYSGGLLVVTFPLAERPTRKLSVQITTRGSA